jgi:hypothetical protein
MADHYGIDKYFALAVAATESSKGHNLFRFGKAGRYHLPWGIHEYVIKERGWPVQDVYVQTEVAIRAIAMWKRRTGSLRKGMARYNCSFTTAYWHRIKELEARFRQERIFD